MGAAETEAIVQAFFCVQRLRLRIQVERREGELEAVNRLVLGRLNRIEQAALKEALRTAKDLQSRLALDYQL